MIDHIWSVMCSSSAIDIDSNSVSLLDVLEQVRVAAEPEGDLFLRIQYDIVSLWIRSNEEQPCRGESRVQVFDPNRELLATFEMAVDLTEHERARNRMHLQGLLAPTPGRYAFRVEVREEGDEAWREVALLPLRVVFESPGSDG